MEIPMTREVGLWLDHRKAVIVIVTDDGEETKTLESNMEKHVRFTTNSADPGQGEDVRDRQFSNHLNKYYDAVIALIGNAESIQIFGPGEAKGELEKRLESKELKGHILRVETVDKMTDRQVAAKVREHFQTESASKR
jgi:hypothetical protein